jgi:SulP family sulfate permease
MTASQIQASALLMFLCLVIIGATGTMDKFGKYIPRAVIRGIQLSTGLMLMVKGIKIILGKVLIAGADQGAEPYLTIQSAGFIPIPLIIGMCGIIITLVFLNNKKLPAALIVIGLGLFIGLLLGTKQGFDTLKPGLYFPHLWPHGFPAPPDFTFALFAVVLPQLPMTLGNAVVAQADLSKDYFGDNAQKMTYTALCFSMAAGNLLSFMFGGMPMCHGAGGLAAHYRFGAKTAGSNLIIGGIMAGLALILGAGFIYVLFLIPISILGVLLIFAGSQLALTISDMHTRNELFVIVTIVALTLAANLAIGTIFGIILAYGIKRIQI